LNDLDRALQMQPDDEKALIVRGQTHRVLHRSQEALRDLNRLLDKRPDNDWAWYQRSLVFWQQGDDRHARQELLQAVKIATQGLERAPANQAIRMNLALYHLANGNVPTAEQHYQETLDSGARHEIILDAISDLDELLALMPDSNQMRAMRDRLSLHTGEG
jgi:Flp pilus assembly protein TadD